MFHEPRAMKMIITTEFDGTWGPHPTCLQFNYLIYIQFSTMGLAWVQLTG